MDGHKIRKTHNDCLIVFSDVFFLLYILASVTTIVSGGLLLHDHLLSTNPCSEYVDNECVEFACEDFLNGSHCPCEEINGNCIFKESFEIPIEPKACKALDGVTDIALYNWGMILILLFTVRGLITLGDISMVAYNCCVGNINRKTEYVQMAFSLFGGVTASTISMILLWIKMESANTCYRDNFEAGSRAEMESNTFRDMWWIVFIASGLDFVFCIFFSVFYSNAQTPLFTVEAQPVYADRGMKLNLEELLRFKKKKILYKF